MQTGDLATRPTGYIRGFDPAVPFSSPWPGKHKCPYYMTSIILCLDKRISKNEFEFTVIVYNAGTMVVHYGIGYVFEPHMGRPFGG